MANDTRYVIIVPCPRDPMVPDAIGPLTDEQTEHVQGRLEAAGICDFKGQPVVTVQLTSADEVIKGWDHDREHHPEFFEPKKVRQFYYHDDSVDNNGNNGPDPLGPGWLVVLGKDMDDAAKKLPKAAQDVIFRQMQTSGAEQQTIEEFMEDTCGWGVGFTLMGEEDWNEEVYMATQQ